MAETFAKRLLSWQGEKSHAEAAKVLGIPKSTFRKYCYGKRTPGALAMLELERRMEAVGNDEKKTKATGELDKAAKGVRRA